MVGASRAGKSLGMDVKSMLQSDEFFGGTSSISGSIGELGWIYANVSGTGAVQMAADNTQLGVAGVITGTTRRNCVSLYTKFSGVSGAGCLTEAAINNGTFALMWRFKLVATTLSVHLGMGYNDQANPDRVVGVRAVPASAAWTTLTVVATGQYARPTAANGRRYYCATAGTTAVGEPTWPTTDGGTVADGTVVWTEDGQDGNANFVFEARNSADETSATTTVSSVAVDTGYHLFKIRYTGSVWMMSLDGGAESSLSKTLSGSFNPLAVIQTESAAAGQLNLDLFRMSMTGLSR